MIRDSKRVATLVISSSKVALLYHEIMTECVKIVRCARGGAFLARSGERGILSLTVDLCTGLGGGDHGGIAWILVPVYSVGSGL